MTPNKTERREALAQSREEDGKGELVDEAVESEAQPGRNGSLPERISTPRRRALYQSLNRNEELAVRIDDVVKHARPNGCRGGETLDRVIKYAMWEILQDKDEVERIFSIVRAAKGADHAE